MRSRLALSLVTTSLGALAACSSSSDAPLGASSASGSTTTTSGAGGATSSSSTGGAGGATTTTGTGGATSSGGAGGAATSAGGAGGSPPPDPGPCSSEGGLSCGGNGIAGSPDTLYVCQGGQWTVDHACGGPCEVMPAGVPDRCPSDVVVPAGLAKVLSPKPYVEESCKPTTWKGWPYDAQKCTYTSGGITTSVTVANPSPDQVATWIVDAAVFVPALWKLRDKDPSAWLDGLKEFALHTLYQSSRIFPLEGGIIENMNDGNGYVNYPFDRGVAEGCSSGCYCRINSLHRTEWCGYQAFLGPQTYDDCIAKIGDSGLTDAWGDECLQNHIDAWTSPKNDHYRAMAWRVNNSVKKTCGGGAKCSPAEVVAAVHAALN